MRLKQIKLAGFKSFVDPIVFSLEHQLVGIVGPNGCGKSNIIDAIRWVLGESSAKDLRGESMLDVIFNGSNVRKPIGRATVELLFDNTANRIGQEYVKFNEISVRREIERDKPTEYYLNDRKCRKRDLVDLFAGTGLSENGYAIVGQGMVGKIITSKPEELRIFIEEAAELSIYKRRRHETQLRMEHTKENLTRLQDLVNEQNRNLEKLEKQSVIANKYQNYVTDKSRIEHHIIYIKAHSFQLELAQYTSELQELSLNLENLLFEQGNVQDHLNQQKLLHSQQLDLVNQYQTAYYQVNAEIIKLEQKIQYQQQQVQRLLESLALVGADLQKITLTQQQDQAQAASLEQALLEMEQLYTNCSNHKDNVEKTYYTKQQQLQELQVTVNQVELQLQQAHNQSTQTKNSIAQIENLSKELNFRIGKLTQEYSSYDHNNIANEIEFIEQDLSIQEQELTQQEQELAALKGQIADQKFSIKNLFTDKQQLQSKLHVLQGKLGSLQTLQQTSLDWNKHKLNWLAQHNFNKDQVFYNELRIEDGWEVAIAVLLHRYLDGIMLQHNLSELAPQLWDSIKDFKLTLIEHNNMDPMVTNNRSIIDDLIPAANKLLNANPGIAWLENCYVTEDLMTALQHQTKLNYHEICVTKQGELVGKNWLSIDRIDPKQKILLINKELQHLQTELLQVEQQLIDLQEHTSSAEQALFEFEQLQLKLLDSIKQQETIIRKLVAELSSKRSTLDGIRSRLAKINTETTEYQTKLVELSNTEQQLRSTLAATIETIANLTLSYETALNNKNILQAALDPLFLEHQQAIKNFHEVSLKRQELVTKKTSIADAHQRSLEQWENLIKQQEQLQLGSNNNRSAIEPLQEQLAIFIDTNNTNKLLLEQAQNELHQLSVTLNSLEQQQTSCNQKITTLNTALQQVKLNKQAVEIRLLELEQTAANSNINLSELLDPAREQQFNFVVASSTEELATLQQQLNKVIQNINKLGPVNLGALEEFNLELARKNNLALQLQDLTTALSTLEEAIDKIDNETKKKFKYTYEKVNTNLQELFPKLFGGGAASLALTSNNLLESGVSFFAQPPGKKNSSIHLLSGGEKALAAIALILAIFQLNPAPFCILDEVDAPLDDANVHRFADLIKSMSDQVQFIFITHNKNTMKIAQQLIGVTMKEPGVSRIVAVNLDEATALVDH